MRSMAGNSATANKPIGKAIELLNPGAVRKYDSGIRTALTCGEQESLICRKNGEAVRSGLHSTRNSRGLGALAEHAFSRNQDWVWS
jgi:hypothetical protein